MTEYILPVRTANAILQNFKKESTYLVIEGPSDFIVYSKFMDKSFCEIRIGHGNENVIEILEILQERGVTNVIGIIDADFRILENDVEMNASLFITDFHDLELMAFRSDSLEIVINHYAIPEKLNNLLEERAPKDLRNIFLDLASPLGYLRWANKRFDLGLTFKPKNPDGKDLNFAEFITMNNLELNEKKMVETVINYSRNKSNVSTTLANSQNRIRELTNENIDLLQLCNGHDIMSLISLSLRRTISNKSANSITPSQIQKEIFFAYDSRFFEQTKLYAQLKDWEVTTEKRILRF